ncbi:unnamed protein product [Alternaria alternata]
MVAHTTILTAIIGFSLLAVPGVAAPAALVAPSAAAVAAGERLGGIDMNRACRDQYDAGAIGIRVGDTCNDWRCGIRYYPGVASVNTPAACTRQYGPGVYAWCSGGWDKWSCYRA